jgi:hypothetical protein
MTQPELEAELNGLRELVSQMQKQQESTCRSRPWFLNWPGASRS